jgi:hypothetical protein
MLSKRQRSTVSSVFGGFLESGMDARMRAFHGLSQARDIHLLCGLLHCEAHEAADPLLQESQF